MRALSTSIPNAILTVITRRHLLFTILTAACLPGASRAQEDSGIAYVAPTVPDDPNLARVAMLRLVYMAGADAPQIALARGTTGGKATLIEGNLSPDTASPYVAMLPAKFTLHVLDNAVSQLEGDLPLEEKKLAESIDLKLTPGAYTTLIISQKDGALTATAVRDEPGTGESATLRVLDLSGLSDWAIRLVERNGKPLRNLWTSGNTPTGIQVPSRDLQYFEVLRLTDGKLRQIGLFETQLRQGTALTIVLHPGWKSQGGASLIFDAAPGDYYDRDAIRALAGGEAP